MAFFTCRTLAPWDEVRCGVSTSTGLLMWMNELYGEELITWGQLAGVRVWMESARDGDVINLSDEGGHSARGRLRGPLQPHPVFATRVSLKREKEL
jgi:hypothetical protein